MSGTLIGLFSKLVGCASRHAGCDRGFATAISMIGPLLATTALVTTVTVVQRDTIETLGGLLSSSVSRVERPLEIRGTVLARPDASGSSLGSVTLPLALLTDTEGMALAGEDGLVVAYHDSDEYVADVPYTVEWLKGDGDAVLEYGEVALLTLSLEDGVASTHGFERWTVDLLFGTSGELSVTRRLPPVLQPLMPLH
jgi:hypothetical protein